MTTRQELPEGSVQCPFCIDGKITEYDTSIEPEYEYQVHREGWGHAETAQIQPYFSNFQARSWEEFCPHCEGSGYMTLSNVMRVREQRARNSLRLEYERCYKPSCWNTYSMVSLLMIIVSGVIAFLLLIATGWINFSIAMGAVILSFVLLLVFEELENANHDKFGKEFDKFFMENKHKFGL